MSAAVLALVVADPGGGFHICDSRSGKPLCWRGDLSSANDVAVFLNSTYPAGAPAPAHDSLVHEIICWRVAGGKVPSLGTDHLLNGLLRPWPTYLPVGPGWDHIYEEVERHAAG